MLLLVFFKKQVKQHQTQKLLKMQTQVAKVEPAGLLCGRLFCGSLSGGFNHHFPLRGSTLKAKADPVCRHVPVTGENSFSQWKNPTDPEKKR